jgi:hypothetical protein
VNVACGALNVACGAVNVECGAMKYQLDRQHPKSPILKRLEPESNGDKYHSCPCPHHEEI